MVPDLTHLRERIAEIVRAHCAPLCANCLTGLMADVAGADELDIRVVAVHLALSPGLTAWDTCGKCGLPEERRNPVIKATIDGITPPTL